MGNLCGGRRDKEKEQLAFMTCILKVKSFKQGWESSVIRVLKSCKEVRFQMDEKGMVEINGIGNPEIVLEKIGRSSNIELQKYQFGQCSGNLFMQKQQPNILDKDKQGKDRDRDEDKYHSQRQLPPPPPPLFPLPHPSMTYSNANRGGPRRNYRGEPGQG